ncbi:hypothetical protein OOK31_13025 [Streptomyces sp. NBC_00249]|uniref:hypothetical protein n=1 Tax=Streptomyces sp. NBC_00249 TaxID=2975690 RepID=UPI002257DF6D|nr:hypothetical protein [Streptomyces sp. NBC_00249]MCX5194810.1 hypothetical protein [Streptomyces sp. NBC_00249]
MKKSAKTLGVAALGAAFAVAAAGAASAAPALPAVGLTDLAGSVTSAVQGATSQQHVSGEEGQPASDPAAPVTGLLGGLAPATGALNGLGG